MSMGCLDVTEPKIGATLQRTMLVRLAIIKRHQHKHSLIAFHLIRLITNAIMTSLTVAQRLGRVARAGEEVAAAKQR